MALDPHVQKIIQWRESFITLPDTHFFEIIRMYLGEIKSPFNKQKLVEELGSFLRKEENRSLIVSLLSENDVEILAAIRAITDCTQEKLASFFNGSFSFTQLYERLLNFEERLLIYRYIDKRTNRQIIDINPMLDETLSPYISIEKILYPSPVEKVNFNVNTALSPELIASYISFVGKNKDLCKQDGTLKKRTIAEAQKYFGERTELLQSLTTAFINLSLFSETSDGFEINQSRLKAFAQLDDIKQYAFLCVASFGHFSRQTLVRRAKLLIDTAFGTGDAGFDRKVIVRNALLISEKADTAPGIAAIGGGGRFAALMAKAAAANGNMSESGENSENSRGEDGSSVMDQMFETAVLMGFFDKKGRTESNENVYVTGYFLKNRAVQNPNSAGGCKVLSIDAAFNVTLMPGLKLKDLMSLVSMMELKQFDTAAVFEINKKSVMRAFDAGFTKEKILTLLQDYSAYQLPQNLVVSINDWDSTYSSANLYRGFVLQVGEDNSRIVENNKAIAPHIVKTLAPGIFILDCIDDEEMKVVLESSGLDFIGKIKDCARKTESALFPDFTYSADSPQIAPVSENGLNNSQETVKAVLSTEKARNDHFEKLRAHLESMTMGAEQKDGLLLRIKRKIILNETQLKPETVHFERLEAGGMDFNGKVHIIESAIKNKDMIEMEYADLRLNEGKPLQIIGQPVNLEKHDYDTIMRMVVEPEGIEQNFSVSRASYVKRVRGSVLK